MWRSLIESAAEAERRRARTLRTRIRRGIQLGVCLTISHRVPLPRSFLFRDDPILDLVVRRLREDLLLNEFVFPFVRPTLDDLL